jgi:glycosyltransferase involved in cell wall biosynthesis
MIKVVHLWIGDSPAVGGGGAGSMYRLHSNLRKAGLDSRILCERKTINSPYIDLKPSQNRLESILGRFTSAVGLNDIHRISSWNIMKYPSIREADILNFHGIHSGFFSYLALPQITTAKPTIFTLRDMWCLTGHCAVPCNCERWRNGCGKCPGLHLHPPVKRDSTRLEWKLKNWSYGRSKLTIVALSQWLAEQAKQSMLSRFPIHVIPNGVDTEALLPLDPLQCKYALGIPERKKVIIFVATNLQSLQKGADLLLKSLNSIPQSLKSEIVLLSLGRHGDKLAHGLGMMSVNLGFIENVRLKAVAFSAADLFLFPSRAEAFGQVILESFACGTPVVSHKVGPLAELVRHGYTGYVAKPEDTGEMSEGVIQLLEDNNLRAQIGKNCRNVAVEEYSLERETQRYISLYKNVLQKD